MYPNVDFGVKSVHFFNDMLGLIRTIIALMSAGFIVRVLEPRAETQTEQQTKEKLNNILQ